MIIDLFYIYNYESKIKGMRSIRVASRALTLCLTLVVSSSVVTGTPANATDWDTCNIIWFQYSGGGVEGTGSAPGLVKDQKVFGSESNSPDCQGYVDHSDSTMLESVDHTGSQFNFVISGNYVGNKTTCAVSVKLNNEQWIQGGTHFEADTYQTIPGMTTGGQNLYLPSLTTQQKNLFNSLTQVGNNEFKVTTDCPGYEQANLTLTANLKIVQDSFNDFEGVSVNDAAEFTNSRNVNVNLSFDSGVVGQVMISNDGGFPSSQRQIFTYGNNTVPWTLNATRDERMVKTIYVKYKFVDRYTGELESTWSRTLTDDIILDTTVPVIKTAEAVETNASTASLLTLRSVNNSKTIKVTLSATDNKSGVSKVQYSTTKSATGAVTRNYAKSFNASFSTDVAKLYIRVKDKAGNWSAWRTSIVTKTYSNCTALNKVYPGGVAKSSKAKNKGGKTKNKPTVNSAVYTANASKDRDRDNIACEK